MDKNVLDEIYAYWFGTDMPGDELRPDRIKMWMDQSDEIDRVIRERFGSLLPAAAEVDWNPETLTREQAVALVVLFDQFPRNLYRRTGEAFAYDHLARDIARQLIATGWERFTLMERFLLGLPFVHNESVDDQDYALKLASEIVLAIPPGSRDLHRIHLDQTRRHRDIIRRFGRFPHRNEMLGRVSTPEEEAFLAGALNGRGF